MIKLKEENIPHLTKLNSQAGGRITHNYCFAFIPHDSLQHIHLVGNNLSVVVNITDVWQITQLVKTLAHSPSPHLDPVVCTS